MKKKILYHELDFHYAFKYLFELISTLIEENMEFSYEKFCDKMQLIVNNDLNLAYIKFLCDSRFIDFLIQTSKKELGKKVYESLFIFVTIGTDDIMNILCKSISQIIELLTFINEGTSEDLIFQEFIFSLKTKIFLKNNWRAKVYFTNETSTYIYKGR